MPALAGRTRTYLHLKYSIALQHQSAFMAHSPLFSLAKVRPAPAASAAVWRQAIFPVGLSYCRPSARKVGKGRDVSVLPYEAETPTSLIPPLALSAWTTHFSIRW